jgi:ABC-2 type transport system permease protein
VTARTLARITRAFFLRDLRVALSYRLPFVMQLGSTFFSLMLLFFLARVVDAGGPIDLPGMQRGYFAFVVIGMVVFQLMITSLSTFTSQIRSEQVAGTLEAMLSSPVPSWLVVLASSAYTMLWSAVTAIAGLVFALFIGLRFSTSAGALGAASVNFTATVVLFAALGIGIAGFTMVFKQGNSLVGVVTSGVSLLSGIYFPVEVLPAWLQVLARAVPFTWSIDLLRRQLLDADPAWGQTLALAGLSVPLLLAGLVVFRLGVDRARRAGSLATY